MNNTHTFLKILLHRESSFCPLIWLLILIPVPIPQIICWLKSTNLRIIGKFNFSNHAFMDVWRWKTSLHLLPLFVFISQQQAEKLPSEKVSDWFCDRLHIHQNTLLSLGTQSKHGLALGAWHRTPHGESVVPHTMLQMLGCSYAASLRNCKCVYSVHQTLRHDQVKWVVSWVITHELIASD